MIVTRIQADAVRTFGSDAGGANPNDPMAPDLSRQEATNVSGTLFLVPTPIGNFNDISLRAVETLRNVDLIAAEDTREAAKLLRHFCISTRTISYHDHNESARTPGLIERLKGGSNLALMSDAGTPLLSDPGFRLVTAAIQEGILVTSLPGPSAITTALPASGLPVSTYYFVGYLPRKAGRRIATIKETERIPATLVFFEAPHRLLETLRDLHGELGDRQAAVGWNLTKENEHIFRGTLSELLAEFSSWDRMRGEITLMVAAAVEENRDAQWETAAQAIRLMLEREVSSRVIRDVVSELYGLPKKAVYEMIILMVEDSEIQK